MKTKRWLKIGGMLLFLLLLFAFVSLDAAMYTSYPEKDLVRKYEDRGAIIETGNTIGLDLVQETSHFNKGNGNLVKIEYFFDTDPGYGNGMPLAFTPGDEITIDEAIPVSSLEEGIHIFYIRVCDETGHWSQTLNRIFLKTQLQTDNPYNITRVEYFFDTDPGFGKGNAAEFTVNNEITLANNWSANSLADGIHMLYVRAFDEFGQWSQTFQRLFLKTHLQTDVVNIEGIEYFFDTDPGNGNGIKIANTADEQITVEQIIPVEDLSDGLHSINIRGRSAGNKWGQLYRRGFIKYPASDIIKVEYYFDDDPGQGNGTDLPVTPSQMVIIDDVLPVESLVSGNHTINIRALSKNDKWSDVLTATITVFGGVGVDEKSRDKAFVSVYPNPTSGVLMLDVNGVNTPLEIQLVSVGGSVLLNRKVITDSNITLNLNSYTNGMYILRFVYKDEVRTQNIILSK